MPGAIENPSSQMRDGNPRFANFRLGDFGQVISSLFISQSRNGAKVQYLILATVKRIK